jgi:hypothetical protein
VPLLEAEVAREAAAAGVQHLGVDAQRGHDRPVGLGAQLGVLVAVHLHQGPAAGRDHRGAQGVGVLGEQLGERAHPGREARDERVVGQQLGGVARRAAVQDGSSPTTGTPALSHGSTAARLRPSTRRAVATCPVDVQVSPQHTCAAAARRVPQLGEHRRGRPHDGRVERRRERVGPKQHPPARPSPGRPQPPHGHRGSTGRRRSRARGGQRWGRQGSACGGVVSHRRRCARCGGREGGRGRGTACQPGARAAQQRAGTATAARQAHAVAGQHGDRALRGHPAQALGHPPERAAARPR